MRIGILTSGGDAPGMNAAIRGAVRQADALGHEAWGIRRGYQGLLDRDLAPLPSRACANILQRGGTLLQTDRCLAFHQPEVRAEAARVLAEAGVDALVVIGGDGSFRGAEALWREHGVACAGIPATIDNDLPGTERTLGFDTALNTAVEAIDRIRDTAHSHGRLFLIEVMGRSSGMLAVHTALACGAEAVLYPESQEASLEALVTRLQAHWKAGKRSSIVVVAEGDHPGGALALGETLRRDFDLELRVVVLGHVQRGGSPTALDRIWGSRWGAEAVRRLDRGEKGFYLGEAAGALVARPIERVREPQAAALDDLGTLVSILSR